MSTPETPQPPTDPLAKADPTAPGLPEPPFIPPGEQPASAESGAEVIRHEEDFQEAERGYDLDVAAAHGAALEELEERHRGFVPIPFSLLALFGLTMAWAFVYLGFYSGGFKSNIFNEAPGYNPQAGAAAPVDPVKLGEKVFIANCAQCHQQTGLGMPGQFPPLAGSEWVVGPAPNRLTQILLHGLQGTVHVKGAVFNNQMPPWNTLKDEQIAAVLTYVRQAWGNSAPPITKEQMAVARKKTEARSEAWSEAELLKIPAGPIEGGEAAPAAGGANAPAPAPAPATGAGAAEPPPKS